MFTANFHSHFVHKFNGSKVVSKWLSCWDDYYFRFQTFANFHHLSQTKNNKYKKKHIFYYNNLLKLLSLRLFRNNA